MSKKDWKKQLLRMKQLADQNLGRSEKSEVLTDELLILERQVNQIRDAWQSIVKKLQACLASHTGEAEKRLRKLPEYALTNCLIDLAATFNVDTIQGKAYNICGEAQLNQARGLVQYGFEIEARVIQPAQILLERDIPSILKLRRQLANLTLDMDSAKSRYQALGKQTQSAASAARLEAAREELDTAEAKVEHCKDVFATEMYTFFAREDELCRMLLLLLEAQSVYHRQSLDALDRLIPTLKEEIDLLATRPVFGLSLEDHLRHSRREIAIVMEDCVVAILRKGLDVEGIFRIAPGASKVKKLKAAFDANMVDTDEYDNDIHCFCAALKHYLRELPQPIMTFELFNEWILASQRPAEQRLNALWVVVDKLPKHNYNNLRYLIKFLAKVTEHSELNKMTASNLAIVFGPNLLWSPEENRNDIHATSCLTLVVETLIASSEWFFPGDIDFPSATEFPSSTLASSSVEVVSNRSQAKVAFLAAGAAGGNGGNGTTGGMINSSSAGSLLEQSPGPETTVASAVPTNVSKPPRKIKKAAPAPPVPSGNHHQRSASVTILTSTLQELTSSEVTTRDDLVDRKVATMTRPKVPPPARPMLPTLPPVKDHPVQLEVASGKEERAERSFDRENVLRRQNMLDILPPFTKKPVSRSLDDVVSESCHGEGSVNTSYESEAISDTEDVFPHRCTPNLSLNMSVTQSEDSEASFGADEQAVMACLENALCEHDQPSSDQALPDQSVHQVSSVRERLPEQDGSNVAVWKSSAESRAGGQIAQNFGSQSEVGFPVSTPDVSVEPPTPEVSAFRYGEFHSVHQPPCLDKSNDLSKPPDIASAHSVLCRSNLPADHSLSSSELVAQPKESDSEYVTQNAPATFQLKRDNAETESWRVASGVVDAHEVATGMDGRRINVVTGEERHEVTSTANRFTHRVGDTQRQDFGTTKETEFREAASIKSYKDRHESSTSDCRLGVVAEKEVVSSLGISSGRERSTSDAVMVGGCQEMGIAAAKQRNDVVSVRPYKDRQEANAQVDSDESQDLKSYDYRTYGVFGKSNELNRKLDDFENERDDLNQKMGEIPQKPNAFETSRVAKPGVTSTSFMTSTKPVVGLESTRSSFERPMKPVDFVSLGATPAGNSFTSAPSSESVYMTSTGTSSSFVATSTSTGSSMSNVMTPTKPTRAGVIPAGSDSTSVALTKPVGVMSTGTGSSSLAPSHPTNTSVNAVTPTKLTDHSEMVQSLKLFFLSGSMNPDQAPTTATRGRSNSDLNLFRPAAEAATSLSKSNVDASSDSGRVAPTATHYSSSMDIRSNTMSSKENFSTIAEPSSPRHLLQLNAATEGGTRIAHPGVPPPPPVRRNRPSDSSTTSATARRSIDDTSKIVIEDTRL